MHQCLQDQNSIDFRVPIIYRVCPQFNLLSVGRLFSTWKILLPLNCSLNIPIFTSPDIYKHGLNVTLKAVTEVLKWVLYLSESEYESVFQAH